jgi:hypothetical protein
LPIALFTVHASDHSVLIGALEVYGDVSIRAFPNGVGANSALIIREVRGCTAFHFWLTEGLGQSS